MIKYLSFIILFLSFMISSDVFAKELYLQNDKIYLLEFDEEILNYNVDNDNLDAQILHTIFDDRKHLILSLTGGKNNILQVKTENNLYNYHIKSSNFSSDELIEIDYPPIENLDVDIYDGE